MAQNIKRPSLTIIIIAANEQDVISNCLKTAHFADQILLVSSNCTDNTISIAKKTNPSVQVVVLDSQKDTSFSYRRTKSLEYANSQWILYLDADERITQKLQKEIVTVISKKPDKNRPSWYVIPRANYHLGKRVRYGGTYPDFVKRLFWNENIKGWRGDVHEEPVVEGKMGILKNDLLHFTHRQLSTMVDKTIRWTKHESDLLYSSQHPPVYWWRFPRMMFTTLYHRLIKQQIWRDGIVGWISVIFEMYNTFIIYARLWEQQHEKRRHL